MKVAISKSWSRAAGRREAGDEVGAGLPQPRRQQTPTQAARAQREHATELYYALRRLVMVADQSTDHTPCQVQEILNQARNLILKVDAA